MGVLVVGRRTFEKVLVVWAWPYASRRVPVLLGAVIPLFESPASPQNLPQIY